MDFSKYQVQYTVYHTACELVLFVAVFMLLFISGDTLKKEREPAHEIIKLIACANPRGGGGSGSGPSLENHK